MTIPEIIAALTEVGSQIPEAALAAAAEQRDAITPELLRAVEDLIENPQRHLDDDDYLPTIAIYLLAQFREPRAWPLLQQVCRLPAPMLEYFGDSLNEDGQRWLASVCGDDTAGLLALVTDEGADWSPRVAAIHALGVRYLWDECPRPQLIEHYRGLFQHWLARPGDPEVAGFLVAACADHELPELLPDIRQAYARGLVAEDVCVLKDIEKELLAPRGQLATLRDRNPRITDTAVEIGWWSCFQTDSSKEDFLGDDDADWEDAVDPNAEFSLPPTAPHSAIAPFVEDGPLPPEPYRAGPKVGRNDPCPCGSGRKFKKCCGANR